MNGRITVESELGKGSSFIVEIPVKKGKQDRRTLLNPNIDWKNLRMFAVDDDLYEEHYFQGLAKDLGVFCETASSAKDALIKLEANRDHPFDIMFVDLNMPVMNGIELIENIRSRFPSSVIILMSSIIHWENIETKAKQVGVDGFLSKPLFSSQIINSITHHLLSENELKKDSNDEDEIHNIFSGFRILLAEDIDINREIVLSLLETTGAEIDEAENGLEAVRIFEERPFVYDAILMDIHMPEMDGFEATRKIRQIETEMLTTASFAKGETRRDLRKQIPIIAMTANVFKEDIDKCFAAGMNDHIGKPLDFEDLIIKLKKYLLDK
jgi:CheY-like chemotaxis protein